jgi:hypothetical protein
VSGLRHLTFESFIAASPERVFAFHERPDAFALLTPWWSGARVVRTAPSLRPGERALLVLVRGPLSVEWEAVHDVYDPPKCFHIPPAKRRHREIAAWHGTLTAMAGAPTGGLADPFMRSTSSAVSRQRVHECQCGLRDFRPIPRQNWSRLQCALTAGLENPSKRGDLSTSAIPY